MMVAGGGSIGSCCDEIRISLHSFWFLLLLEFLSSFERIELGAVQRWTFASYEGVVNNGIHR
jgi:hypothetical protein